MRRLAFYAGLGAVTITALAMPLTAGASSTSRTAAPPACLSQAWKTFGVDLARTGDNPCEKVLNVSNVGSLKLKWKVVTAGQVLAQPTYAPGIVIGGVKHNVLFIGDEAGLVQAVDTTNGKVLWKRQLGKHVSGCSPGSGVSGAPVLDLATNTGYLVDGLDKFYAINLATGLNKPGFTPLSVGNPTLDHVYASVTLSNGIAYVATASYCDGGNYFGRVYGVDVAHHTIAHTFTVVPPSTGSHAGGIWGPGGVSVDAANGAVYAATGNSIPGEHKGYGEQIVRLTANLAPVASNYTKLVGGDVDYGATPLLYQPSGCDPLLVAKNKSGVLVVYKRNAITAGPFQKIQVASNTDYQFNGIPAYDATTRVMVVTSSSDQAPYSHGIIGFKVGANCMLTKIWQQAAGVNKDSKSPPTIANGVVYFGDGRGNTERAYNLATGAPLWNSGAKITGSIFAAPAVTAGRVYVGSWDKHYYAFGL